MSLKNLKKINFIHIPKTGGASIQHTLQNSNWGDVGGVLRHHQPINKKWGGISFAVVRNPYSRVKSMYNFYKNSRNVIKENNLNDFITNLSNYQGIDRNLVFNPCFDFISINNVIEVDYILKYENLQEDFKKLCNTLNLPVNIDLPKLNITNNKTQTEYTFNSINIINNTFHDDFINFNYTKL